MANKGSLLQELIRKKRDGDSLTDQEIEAFVEGVVDQSASDGQIGAFAMAVLLRGMSASECTALSLSMRDSGEVICWDHLNLQGPIVDKHSTGGVGDCVSLMLAPMLAACGAFVPMISGRGLGHTGGTLDKLSSIPGYDLKPNADVFKATVAEIGCAIIGQTSTLAPADGRIYSVRDVTATVESIPLITASILSKKLSAGLDNLVMDIKLGNGAFMTELSEAKALAESIRQVAKQAGLITSTLITDMNQPLARAAGNALEVRETVHYLTGEARDPRLHEVVIRLASALLIGAGLASSRHAAAKKLETVLVEGQARDHFDAMIQALGGPQDFCQTADKYLPKAPVVCNVLSPTSGFVNEINTRQLGLSVVSLGGGRRHPDDEIDLSVGLEHIVRCGDPIKQGDSLCLIHARDKQSAAVATKSVLNAFEISSEPFSGSELIVEEVV
ncbi:thymidine phosphorylase [Arenicellales bacterium nBUS_48]